tara:strand:+ start:68735 stop:69400 length:666 start_codon:yes stop_codon:yes gene_type:complete
MKNNIIAIDGYASTGKTTLSKRIAKHLKYIHIDTGSMYRAFTLFAIENGVHEKKIIKKNKLENLLEDISFSFSQDNELLFKNNKLSDKIRSTVVSDQVSKIASLKIVRKYMVNYQRNLVLKKNCVVEGRDIGSIVFPNANIKFFMDADVEVRAKRRYNELMKNNTNISYTSVLKNVSNRDKKDTNRSVAPLKKVSDSIIIDTTNLSIDQAFNLMLKHVKNI